MTTERRIVGIDPGASGAIAYLRLYGLTPMEFHVWDMPTTLIAVSGKNRRRIDINALFNLPVFDPSHQTIWMDEAWVEDVHSMPTDGPVQAFSFGFATGLIHGVLHGWDMEPRTVAPAVWKGAMGVTKDKATSIARAKAVLPKWADQFTKSKDGRAEAALIAVYGAAMGGK